MVSKIVLKLLNFGRNGAAHLTVAYIHACAADRLAL